MRVRLTWWGRAVALRGREVAFWWLLLWGGVAGAYAGGPRWVTGAPYFSTTGQSVVWYTNAPQYYTDPGGLGPGVDHAAADALVAAAASVWNIPTASLVLGQGGALDEHVSGQNVYASTSGPIYPADVQPQNGAAKQIAVIYDTDGSVTDLLLGSGASDPSGCMQNGVTESVDSITPDGLIRHALLILNGRCAGPAQEQQLQMQYQVMRAFGRILGLAWSQTNDNVFTYAPQPTYDQAMHWPVMHPIDIICGPYTYQCMPEPFTLRPDDISALGQLYFIAQGTAPAGKTDTQYYANGLGGRLAFPNGEGMQGVNVVARRWQQYYANPEDFYEASSVTGYNYRQNNGNAVSGTDGTLMGSQGTLDNFYQGWYRIARIPIISGDWQNVYLDTEPVNPLYTGEYAVGPYTSNTVLPSGADSRALAYVMGSYLDATWVDISTAGAAAQCNSGADGTESAPAAVGASGWWMDTLCGYGHQAWSLVPVQGGRTFTLEVSAQDEAGNATASKAMPVIGVWNASDATGVPPTVAAVGTAFNAPVLGMTSVSVSSSQASRFRVGLADQRGDGRPDYNYQVRVLYADSITPASLGAAGGTVTITGMGFRPGNAVLVNGVEAQVQSWADTQIVATVPTLRALGTQAAVAADVTVQDLTSGGTTTMSGALAYAASPAEVVHLVSSPSGQVLAGTMAATWFTVQVLGADGVTPVAGEAVTLSASGGSVRLGACGTASCVVLTNALGVASTSVTATSAGAVSLLGVANAGSVAGAFTSVAPPPDRLVEISAPAGVVYLGDTAATPFTVLAVAPDGVTPVVGVPVVFSSVAASLAGVQPLAVQYGICSAAVCTVVTDASGRASVPVTAIAAGAVTLTAAAYSSTVSASFAAVARVRSITPVQSVQYVAAGAVVNWQPEVSLEDNSAAVAGLPVAWRVNSGAMLLAGASSLVSTQGMAGMPVEAGPLPGGTQATGAACAWSTVCATFSTVAVENAVLQVLVASGATQVASAGGALGPVLLRITDGAGHGVAGASVNVYETVTGAEPPCPATGRCPIAPVYQATQFQAISDLSGLVSITPLTIAGIPQNSNVAATVGTNGFVSLALPVP